MRGLNVTCTLVASRSCRRVKTNKGRRRSARQEDQHATALDTHLAPLDRHLAGSLDNILG